MVRTRVFGAAAVTVVSTRGEFAMANIGDDVFAVIIPGEDDFDYRLRIQWADGSRLSAPTVTESCHHWPGRTCTLSPMGRHEQLWKVLGAHLRSYETELGLVEGTSFTVWAPNARGVAVVGDFSYWNGAQYPMRSMGSSGIGSSSFRALAPVRSTSLRLPPPRGIVAIRPTPWRAALSCPRRPAPLSPNLSTNGVTRSGCPDALRRTGTPNLSPSTRYIWAPGSKASPTRFSQSSWCAMSSTWDTPTWNSCRSPSTPSPALGLPGLRLLRPHQPIRQSRPASRAYRRLPWRRYWRHYGLGAGALPQGRVRTRPL